MIPVPESLNWERKLMEIAEITTGFSGREISKLLISWQVYTNTLIIIIKISLDTINNCMYGLTAIILKPCLQLVNISGQVLHITIQFHV